MRFRGFPIGHHMGTDAIDLTCWLSNPMQLTVGYTFQRIKNPGQITSINPFVETFVTDVTSNNHFLWTNVAVQF